MKEVVALSSSGGSLLRHVLENTHPGFFVSKVIVDRECGASGVARMFGIPVLMWEKNRDFSGEALLNALGKPDLIISVGFLSKIPPLVVATHSGRIINSHPSLLPKFGGLGMYGYRVHRAVLASRAEFSGCTVHYVSDEIDEGEILRQEKVRVFEFDDEFSLGKRVHLLEKKILMESIIQLLAGNRDPSTP